ncbi:hypothetical protein [Paraburkholderia sp. SIMBA_054]|uniref:hypothetical protein n=1 Tax=Paraburkholderia sp. SIMBA_054 TaxID=3085795 RepID=UPI003978D41B
MQIIIVQAEIEAAIRNFINSQLNVKDGHRIDIQLSATRGEDGFKATIDIVANDAVPAAPTPAPSPAPIKESKSETAVTASHASVKAPPPPITNITPVTKKDLELQPEPDLTAGEAGNASAGSATDAGATDAAPSSSEPVVAEQPADGEVKPTRSLFAGLKKPVNA